MRRRSLTSAFLLSASLIGGVPGPQARADSAPGQAKTALDTYVAAPDSSYHYSVERTVDGPGFTAYMVRMQSQTWLTEEDVNRTAWMHDVKIICPDEIRSKTGLLFIGGGANGKDVPDSVRQELAEIAVATGSVVTELGQVPNQPLVFKDDPQQKERVEDSLIAFGWKKFLEGEDVRWLARLPMTKSAVRAMDTVTAICQDNEQAAVTSFVVAGASKRGWTTWTTAAVDSRVKAIVPIVIDMLNVRPSFRHHYQAYGFFAPAVDDYVEAGIMDWQETDRYLELLKIVEPYEYRSRFTMPKLLLNASGDQFFLPDSAQFYLGDLPGETHVRYVPNADHSLKGSDAYQTLLAFYAMVLAEMPRPEYRWEMGEDGTLTVVTEAAPTSVKLWTVTNTQARDFRLETVGAAWKSKVLEAKEGRYQVKVEAPEQGWLAYMIELSFATPAGVPLKLTTPVMVTPDRLPHPPYESKRTQ